MERNPGRRVDRSRNNLLRQTLLRNAERRLAQQPAYEELDTSYEDFGGVNPQAGPSYVPFQQQPTQPTQPTHNNVQPESIGQGLRRRRRVQNIANTQVRRRGRPSAPARLIGLRLNDDQLLNHYNIPMNRRGISGLRNGIQIDNRTFTNRRSIINYLRRYGRQNTATPEQAAATNIQRIARGTAIRQVRSRRLPRPPQARPPPARALNFSNVEITGPQAAERGLQIQERAFFNNRRQNISYVFQNANQVRAFFERLLPRLRNGERFMIHSWADTWYTLSSNTYERISNYLAGIEEFTKEAKNIKSDQDTVDAFLRGERITITRAPNKTTNKNWNRRQGSFFPYLHEYEDEHLCQVLSLVGCWKKVDKKNYIQNCLWLALQNAGVSEEVLGALECEFKMRSISRTKLKDIAEKYNLYIEVCSDRDNAIHNKTKFGKPSENIICLAIIEDHWIHNFKTDITSFALKNYHALKDKKEWWKIKSLNPIRKDTTRGMLALDLLKEIDKTSIDLTCDGIYTTQFYDKFNKTEFSILEYPQDDVKLFERKDRENDPVKANVFFDFESSPFDQHEAFSVCYSELNDGFVHKQIGKDCAAKFIDYLINTYGEKEKQLDNWSPPIVKLLAHNITYDMSFFLKHVNNLQMIERGTSVISGSGYLFKFGKTLKLQFQDTYKMIPMALKDFAPAFNLTCKKEVMPYKLYTKTFLKSGGLASLEELKNIEDFSDSDEMLNNLINWKCKSYGGKFDMIKYATIYCEQDVRVLKEGFKIFRESLLNKFNLDAFDFPTISGLSDQYFINQGCFDGVCEMSNIPRQFISNCSIGGRVMCADNQKIRVSGKIADFDGVSLYPSSMQRIPGYLQGRPKVWSANIDLSKVDGYFLKIRVLKVGKKYKFPITRIKSEEGANDWTNELEGYEIFVDRFTLEDLIKYSKIKYEIIQGYYFDEGRNNKVNHVIQYLFDQRLKYKNEKNPLQLVIKLMMNSGYGKTGLKPIDTNTLYVNEDDKNNFIHNHFNNIKQFTPMPNGQWRFDLYKSIDTHYNRQHVACEILSVSKNIMNEVMCLAEDNNINIYYTDTDSMHMDFDEVDRLGDLFLQQYNRQLIGKRLGQFHTDFELVNSKGKIWAEDSIFLGKKTYIDKLVDEAGNSGYHIRMKGIPTKCIHHKAEWMFQNDPMKLYEYLYNGNDLSFDLTTGGNCCFKTHKNHYISTIDMNRSVSFVNS